VHSDEALIEGCKRKDATFEKALYQQYARKMMGICSRYGRTQFESEDIFQDAFVKVYQHIHTCHGALEPWMKRVFVNTAINHFHKNRKQFQEIEYDSVPEIQVENEEILSSITTKELLKLMHQLPEGSRLIFNLFVIEGYSHQEIADMLKIHEGTSKSQLARAKAHLKKLLIILYPSLYAER
jgi:RNA polymerase sigma-70 factor (ECF subfamily)